MHGGYFTSEKCLIIQTVPNHRRLQQLSTSYDFVKFDNDTDTYEITGNALDHIEANSFNDFNSKCDNTETVGSKNANAIDIPKRSNLNPTNYKNFHSQPTLRIRTDSVTSTTSTASSTATGPIPAEWYRCSSGTIYAPATQEVAMNCKNKRYLTMPFGKSEIRPSYSVKQLLRIQKIQRDIKSQTNSSNTVTEQICMKSAYCLNLDLIANKPFVYRPKVYPGMGKTLSRLLFQQNPPPTPDVLLKGQELRRKIEDEKFRCKILLQERDRKKATIRQLNTRLGVLADANIEQESVLMAQYHTLSKDKEAMYQQMLSFAGQKGMLSRIKGNLLQRRRELLQELNVIYEIKKVSE
jgi:UV radiation resistance-associated gene protein